jgi:NAD(P)-dependent dehydrogenase (short-subunit alcohol dehydrogenase family)
MNIYDLITKHSAQLKGKKIAISGSTGGLGKELCFFLAKHKSHLILMDRNEQKVDSLCNTIFKNFGEVNITKIKLDLSDFGLVKSAVSQLKDISPDLIIFNAGAYSIPRKKCDSGLDNVFQINFAAPYFMIKELLPTLRQKGGRVIAVSSIAHNYSKIDLTDLDFSTRKKASLVYGNAKRFLTFSLFELFKNENKVSLSIVHPGITFTGITAHYPKLIFAIIKHPMKIIFMKPKKAVLCIINGLFESTSYNRWIGPKLFNVWGLPKNQPLKTCKKEEREQIFKKAEKIYQKIKNPD